MASICYQPLVVPPILRNNDDGRFHLIDKGLAMEISSTYIREEFAMGGENQDTSCLLLVTTILKNIIFIKNKIVELQL